MAKILPECVSADELSLSISLLCSAPLGLAWRPICWPAVPPLGLIGRLLRKETTESERGPAERTGWMQAGCSSWMADAVVESYIGMVIVVVSEMGKI